MTQNQTPQASPQASLKQYCRQEAETASLAKQLAISIAQWILATPTGHLNIALEGDLGAGKTTLARYLIQGLGHEGKVKSPTYTLCEPYELTSHQKAFTAHHFDLYRMRDPLEWQEAGFAEYFDVPGFCLIEWPEKAEGTIPAFDIQIQLMAGEQENERTISLNAFSAEGKKILKNIQAIANSI
ncbi:tRNA (adenosine(37)-N6)-threonylcarbamoyltransferase complex ATPase subunit type 1 TsaE [Polynucleobacter sp. MWH-Creno-3A4]|uniref:tRNA (adenosine(37)-N6)-threonylcarbamoyltransferase complex ATPase subunit type 1 TsaE n=1 Tax=Polynucleobacter sp. MWH-Creno-3A4 TaxID=1855886 RepID=UPI001C0CA136|nr:tRNA (adenosine(37)-N6)-threonylcarbamoyltransferase complex ATPase subunit type 1 TsaE [Polynucleobacter sp. MWH-Creno-3A4]MBU3605322.1 tRNA (adenosine(37)-N6)-threonylcarbamoyltransferase complex ATPase subunit type 1 TsaE [Polynucleobacter sp. MWH-Creno-3A4]